MVISQLVEEIWMGHKNTVYIVTATDPETVWLETTYFSEEGKVLQKCSCLKRRHMLDQYYEHVKSLYPKREIKNVK